MSNEITNIQNPEIVLYQPDESTSLEVRLEDETVWLTQAQMADLFKVKVPAVNKHIKNLYEEGELQKFSTISILETVRKEGNRVVRRNVEYYNLDVIISVGYRIKSIVGTRFRQWANSVLKQYLLRGYSISQQFMQLERRIDDRLLQQHDEIQEIKTTQKEQQQQLDFFIRTSTPPAEMVFFNGDFFTARVALEQLIKTAKQRAIIIDAYVDAKTFDMLDVRAEGVIAEIYTVGVGAGMTRLRDEHNRQPNVQPIEIYKWRNESHDRWLIIDDSLYHCGHSLNAIGNKMSAITLMGIHPDEILRQIK